jgi:hypothetical protein
LVNSLRGAFAKYLQVLKLHPEKANVRFLPRERQEVFETHEQLEEFHLKCRQQAKQPNTPLDPQTPKRYVLETEEEALLKSFHRAFQFKESLAKHDTCMFRAPTLYQPTKNKVLPRQQSAGQVLMPVKQTAPPVPSWSADVAKPTQDLGRSLPVMKRSAPGAASNSPQATPPRGAGGGLGSGAGGSRGGGNAPFASLDAVLAVGLW